MPSVVTLRGEPSAGAEALIAAGADDVALDRDEALGLFGSDEAARAAGAALGGEVAPAELLDWGSTWARALRPVRVGRLTVAFEGAPGPDRIVLAATRAFGTGLHPTTRLCLERLVERTPDRVLDFGAGSGVLALAALRLGAREAACTENDADAARAADENAAHNGLTLTWDSGGRYPLVLANVLAGPLVALAPELARAVAPGGELALSGFTASQVDGVQRACERLGLRRFGLARSGDWCRLDLVAGW